MDTMKELQSASKLVARLKTIPRLKSTTAFTRKLAHNRGNARIWIEGKALLSNGITNGMRFNLTIDDHGAFLTFCEDGKRKVAGKPDRPIIDINTSKLNGTFSLSHYVVGVWPNGTGFHHGLVLSIAPITK